MPRQSAGFAAFRLLRGAPLNSVSYRNAIKLDERIYQKLYKVYSMGCLSVKAQIRQS